MTPKNGDSGKVVPHGRVQVWAVRSIGIWLRKRSGKSSGSVPNSGRWPQNPQSAPNSIASIDTSSISPGAAPEIATGPVSRCGPSRGICPSFTAASAAGTVMPEPGGGIRLGSPETVSITTVSPLATVSTGS